METHLWIFIDSSTLCFSGKPRALKDEQMLSAMSFLKCSFATEIKLCSVHTDPKEWKIEPNISLNHTANIFTAKKYFYHLFLKEEAPSFNRWANVIFKVFLCYWDQAYTLIQNMVILLWSFKFRDTKLVILWPKNECFKRVLIDSSSHVEFKQCNEDLWKHFLVWIIVCRGNTSYRAVVIGTRQGELLWPRS